MICDRCKREVLPGNRPDGLPYGIGTIINDRVIMLCTDCIWDNRHKLKEWFLKQIKDAGEQDDEVIKI